MSRSGIPTETRPALEAVPRGAWRMLALGVAAQTLGTFLVSAPAFLIPLLHLERGLPLAQAGLIAAAPTLGVVLTLVAWGAVADRFGERWVIAGGLALTAVFALAAAFATDLVALAILLVLGGAASASTSSASGRVVTGWFPRHRRGFAMGVRQISQPLGVSIAALAVPALAAGTGIPAPFLVVGGALGIVGVACAVGIANPPRAAAPSDARGLVLNPYRTGSFLARIHVVSMLLVVPQFAFATFGLVWLIADLGMHPAAAGAVIAAGQFAGAMGRIGIGLLSDRVGSRVRVIRGIAIAGIPAILLVALAGWIDSAPFGVIAILVATTVSVADNGPAFTAVAEDAGSAWAGRALGLQNTGQFVAASAVGPVLGALIAAVGYPLAFALVAITPLAALPVLPSGERPGASVS